jgi:hypothetical protein
MSQDYLRIALASPLTCLTAKVFVSFITLLNWEL